MSTTVDYLRGLPDFVRERRDAFDALGREVRDWNERINLVSRKDIEHYEERHLRPCLAFASRFELLDGERVCDLGTGGGMPGLALAILYPKAKFTLLDSVGKKLGAVSAMAEALSLKQVRVHHGRAEACEMRFEVVTGRAVTALPRFLSWADHLLSRRARAVYYWKGGAVEPELEATGLRESARLDLAQVLEDPYFAEKYILHYEAAGLRKVDWSSFAS